MLATCALLLCFAGALWAYTSSLGVPRLIPGLRLGSFRVGSVAHEDLDRLIHGVSESWAREPVLLTIGAHELRVTRRELGVRVDAAATRAQLELAGKSGNFLQDLFDRLKARRGELAMAPIPELDPEVARAFFRRLKAAVDRPPVDPRLDLERGLVQEGQGGYRLKLYDALATTENALRHGRSRIPLPVDAVAPKSAAALQGIDIRHVLAEFVTVYSLADKDADRAHNLKVGASKLDGRIIPAGARFSFNEVVGPRTHAEGYRTANVISDGELVDGIAGGSCQLSSTLFAAAFFAGLDLLNSRPHTIPSSYIKMGLDAAVAYPDTDLVLRNPYPFPVVIHFVVNQGKVRVQLRGKGRPWRKIAFRREVKESTPHQEIQRHDPEVPRGVRIIDQVGVPGFVLERQRLFFGASEEPEKIERRALRYPPTSLVVRIGTGPANPRFVPPPPKRPFGDAKPELEIIQ
ncbi:MAG: VanW family protein [Deltaproteobacteria bacterium]|nr:VanW family protein [Deltaproteobacteria bacterium]